MGWMGPVIGDVEHEGWVVPLFADGAQGAGASSARGVLVARRPGEGPRDGDRVLVSFSGGSAVEGTWQGGLVIREDGISHAPAGAELQVLEEVEEWRPDAAVVGWVAGCACGWRGRPWTRVHAQDQVDVEGRLLHTPGPYYDLEGPDEGRVMEEWRRHINPLGALEAVEEAASRHAATGRALDEAIRAARAAGVTWTDVGRATGMTRQSASERWASRIG